MLLNGLATGWVDVLQVNCRPRSTHHRRASTRQRRPRFPDREYPAACPWFTTCTPIAHNLAMKLAVAGVNSIRLSDVGNWASAQAVAAKSSASAYAPCLAHTVCAWISLSSPITLETRSIALSGSPRSPTVYRAVVRHQAPRHHARLLRCRVSRHAMIRPHPCRSIRSSRESRS